MSWKFPRHNIRSGYVMDVDDLNENIWEFVEEINGNLNEHNFASSGFSRANVADDAVMRLWVDSTSADPSDRTATPTGYTDLSNSVGWQSAGLSKTFTGGGVLWIIGSLAASLAYPGCLFGIRVDGKVLPWSVVGSTDFEQEPVGAMIGGGAYRTNGGTYILGSGADDGRGNVTAAPQLSYFPVVVEGIAPVADGNHTVEVVAMVQQHSWGASGNTFRIFNRELIVIELRQADVG